MKDIKQFEAIKEIIEEREKGEQDETIDKSDGSPCKKLHHLEQLDSLSIDKLNRNSPSPLKKDEEERIYEERRQE